MPYPLENSLGRIADFQNFHWHFLPSRFLIRDPQIEDIFCARERKFLMVCWFAKHFALCLYCACKFTIWFQGRTSKQSRPIERPVLNR